MKKGRGAEADVIKSDKKDGKGKARGADEMQNKKHARENNQGD